jgi:hypothetical protein
VASGANSLILSGMDINLPNQQFSLFFCRNPLFYILLKYNEINIALEFDTVGRSRLLYHGNGVALIIHFSRQTHLAWQSTFNSTFHE